MSTQLSQPSPAPSTPFPASGMSVIDVDRVRRGFAIRHSRLVGPKAEKLAPSVEGSIFHTLEAQASPAILETNVIPDPRWIPIGTAIRQTSLTKQRAVIASLTDQAVEFPIAYSLGSTLSRVTPSVHDLETLSVEDYSILIESAARAGLLADIDGNDTVLDLSRNFICSVPRAKSNSEERQLFILQRLPNIKGSPSKASIRELRRFLPLVKRDYLHLIGPDVVSLFQALIDPLERLGDGLPGALALAADWELDGAAHSMLFVRLLLGHSEERFYLRENFDRASARLSPEARNCLEQLLDGGFTAEPRPENLASAEEAILFSLSDLNRSLARPSPIDTHNAIVELFELDPSLVEFLPWNRILSTIERTMLCSPEALFTTALMSKPAIRRTSTLVAVKMGTGAFLGDLSTFVQADSKSDITNFLGRFKTLPANSASELARASLERGIFERLTEAVPLRVAPGEQRTAAGLQNSLSRIAALRSARRLKLIETEFATNEIDFEMGQAKLEHFQQTLRFGRVRIPWDTIDQTISSLIEGLPLEFVNSQAGAVKDSEAAKILSSFFATKLSREVLFDSAASFDQVLSDNLRHGVVVPRFLRIFNDALQIMGASTIEEWAAEPLRQTFGDDAIEIIELRDWVNSTLRAFNEAELTVAENGFLHKALRDQFRTIVAGYLGHGSNGEDDLRTAIAATTEDQFTRSLAWAADKLDSNVKSDFFSHIQALRAAKRSSSNPNVLGFLEGLESLINPAFDEVRRWISIAERTNEAVDFTLGDVVSLELLTAHLQDHRKLKVEAVMLDHRLMRQSDDLAILNGRYWDMFKDIIHNMLSNSFKYSGLSLKTSVTIGLSLSGQRLVIRCTNDMSPAKAKTCFAKQAETTQQAREPLALKQARREGLSGFQKMRLATKRCFDREPVINIQIAMRTNRFTVDLIVQDPPEDLLCKTTKY